MHIENNECDQSPHKYQQNQLQKTDLIQNLKHQNEKQIKNNQMKENHSINKQQNLESDKIKEQGTQEEISYFSNDREDIQKSHKQSHSLSPYRQNNENKLDHNNIFHEIICDDSHNLDISSVQNDINLLKQQPNQTGHSTIQLSEPLPLLEKGKYSDIVENQKRDIINETKSQSQMQNKRKNKKKVSNQEQQTPANDQKNNKALKYRGYKYIPDHKCVKISDTLERCNICYGALSSVYYTKNTDLSIRYPFNVCYIDYIPTFIKKMEIQIREKVNCYKRFIQLQSLQEMKQFAYYIVDRVSKYTGMEDFLNENKRIPKCLENYEQKVKCRDFNKIMVMGDYENSNIYSCSINKQNDQLMILLRSDSNTKGCIHWFQFTVIAKEPCTVQFVILNNKRNGQNYKDGMRVAVIESDLDQTNQSQSQKHLSISQQYNWQRKSENIFYYKSNVDHSYYRQTTENLSKEQLEKKQQKIQKRGYQTLDFTYTFEKAGQRVVFAHSFAYTFTDLCNYIDQIEQKLKENQCLQDNNLKDHLQQNQDLQNEIIRLKTDEIYYKKKIIINSRLGFPIYQLKITANKRIGPYKKRKRKVIYIIARQHPGESPSSFVCQGLVSYLLSDSESSKFLRQVYIFKIIPMVNPDGVILGNTRCNVSGFDLNRKWQFPDKKLTPEIYFTKEEIKKTQKKREIMMFCDLHGHSQSTNFFFYGCNKTTDGGTTAWTKVRLLPHILAKRTEFFSLQECRFKVTDDRVSTARVTCWQELGIQYSFTVETSFYGYSKMVYDEKTNKSEKQFFHFAVEDLLRIGESIGEAFVEQLLTLEKLQYELIQTNGLLNAKQKQIETNITFNINNIDNIIEDNWKSTKDSIYNPRNSTSKDKNQIIQNRQSFDPQNKSQSCFQSNSSKIFTPQQTRYDEENQKQKINSNVKGSINFSKANQIPRKVNQQNSSNERDKKKNNINRRNTFNNEYSNDLSFPQNNQKKRNKESLQIFENTQQSDNNIPQLQENYDNLFQERYHPILSDEYVNQICPNILKDWRDYFEKKDLEKNYRIIEQGEDPNDLESDGGSDSEPEEDIYQQDEWPFPIYENQDEEEEEESPKDDSNKNLQNNEIKKSVHIQKKKVFSIHTAQNPQQQSQQRNYYPVSKVGQTFDCQNSNVLILPSAKTTVEPVAMLKKHQKKKQENQKVDGNKNISSPVQNNQNNGGNYINQIKNKNFENNMKDQPQYITLGSQNESLIQNEIINQFSQQNIALKEQQTALKQKQEFLQQQLIQTDQLSNTHLQNQVVRISKNSGMREKTEEDEKSFVKILNMDQFDGLDNLQKSQNKSYKTIIQRKLELKRKILDKKVENSIVQQSKQKKSEDDICQNGFLSEEETSNFGNGQISKNQNDRLQGEDMNLSKNSPLQKQRRGDSQNMNNSGNQIIEIFDDKVYQRPLNQQYNLQSFIQNNIQLNEANNQISSTQDFSQLLKRNIDTKESINLRNSFSINRQIHPRNKSSINQNSLRQQSEIYYSSYMENYTGLTGNEDSIKEVQGENSDIYNIRKRKDFATSMQLRHNNSNNSITRNLNKDEQLSYNNQHYDSSPLYNGYTSEDANIQENMDDLNKLNDSISNNIQKYQSSINQVALKDIKHILCKTNEPSLTPIRDLGSSIKKEQFQTRENHFQNLEKTQESRKDSRMEQGSNDKSFTRTSRSGRRQYSNIQQLIQIVNTNGKFPILPTIQQNNQGDYDRQLSVLKQIDFKRQKNPTKPQSLDTRKVQNLKFECINPPNKQQNNNSFNNGPSQINNISSIKYNKNNINNIKNIATSLNRNQVPITQQVQQNNKIIKSSIPTNIIKEIQQNNLINSNSSYSNPIYNSNNINIFDYC